jgi:uncharacterized protein YchJ
MSETLVIKSPVDQPVQLPKRNGPCVCGSGKKAKRCCLHQYERRQAESLADMRAKHAAGKLVMQDGKFVERPSSEA